MLPNVNMNKLSKHLTYVTCCTQNEYLMIWISTLDIAKCDSLIEIFVT